MIQIWRPYFSKGLKPPTSGAVDLFSWWLFYGFHRGIHHHQKKDTMWIYVGNILSFSNNLSSSKVVKEHGEAASEAPLKCDYCSGIWHLREGMM